LASSKQAIVVPLVVFGVVDDCLKRTTEMKHADNSHRQSNLNQASHTLAASSTAFDVHLFKNTRTNIETKTKVVFIPSETSQSHQKIESLRDPRRADVLIIQFSDDYKTRDVIRKNKRSQFRFSRADSEDVFNRESHVTFRIFLSRFFLFSLARASAGKKGRENVFFYLTLSSLQDSTRFGTFSKQSGNKKRSEMILSRSRRKSEKDL
jgi:hypothetical protein